jgi:hypothetical protein
METTPVSEDRVDSVNVVAGRREVFKWIRAVRQQFGAILRQVTLLPEACLLVDTNTPHLRDHFLCDADKHGPRRLLGLRPAVPIRELSTSCLLHPTTSRRARGLNPWADGRPAESRGIVASSWERV